MYAKYAKLRDEKGWNDHYVCKLTNIPSSTMSEWKNGKYTPKVDKIAAIARLFGVSVDFFISETGDGKNRGNL